MGWVVRNDVATMESLREYLTRKKQLTRYDEDRDGPFKEFYFKRQVRDQELKSAKEYFVNFVNLTYVYQYRQDDIFTADQAYNTFKLDFIKLEPNNFEGLWNTLKSAVAEYEKKSKDQQRTDSIKRINDGVQVIIDSKLTDEEKFKCVAGLIIFELDEVEMAHNSKKVVVGTSRLAEKLMDVLRTYGLDPADKKYIQLLEKKFPKLVLKHELFDLAKKELLNKLEGIKGKLVEEWKDNAIPYKPPYFKGNVLIANGNSMKTIRKLLEGYLNKDTFTLKIIDSPNVSPPMKIFQIIVNDWNKFAKDLKDKPVSADMKEQLSLITPAEAASPPKTQPSPMELVQGGGSVLQAHSVTTTQMGKGQAEESKLQDVIAKAKRDAVVTITRKAAITDSKSQENTVSIPTYKTTDKGLVLNDEPAVLEALKTNQAAFAATRILFQGREDVQEKLENYKPLSLRK